MSMYGEPSIADLLPAYYCNNYMLSGRRQNSQNCPSIWRGILTHLFVMAITVGLCLGGYFYYHNIYLPQQNEKFPMGQESSPIQAREGNEELKPEVKINYPETSNAQILTEDITRQLNRFKEELANIHNWRTTTNTYLTKQQWEQDVKIQNAVEEALELYEADGIGLMDYAASYAGGIIVGISTETLPHPTHRPLTLFRIVNVDVLSSPEEIIRPCVLPGSCFAFRGHSGSIRIKLGKPISIGGITLSHASRFLLGVGGMSSAPKQFEVHGFTDIDDEIGTFLGRFEYDWKGRQHQTFEVKKHLSGNQIFEEVGLSILSNYGKKDFTCVYRFRVHKSDAKNTGKYTQTTDPFSGKKTKKCC